ncbi:glycosyltransferase [Cohnella suwonensis]|uniref:Glycosyltransferase n=1 Tax=Cohnella suwonensis TaxID=696072 RepID=A0ABW0LVE5_9BACL
MSIPVHVRHVYILAPQNPNSVLRAYRERRGRPPWAIGRLGHQDEQPATFGGRKLENAAEGLPHVRIIDRVMRRADVTALLNCCDCYVSLHRALGFGLPLAEAMSLGKPVICTNWSGNTDFMTPDNSGAVRFRLVRIGHDFGPYKAHKLWAESDVEHAAHLMKRVVYDDEWRSAIARRGRETISESFSLEASGRRCGSGWRRYGENSEGARQRALLLRTRDTVGQVIARASEHT